MKGDNYYFDEAIIAKYEAQIKEATEFEYLLADYDTRGIYRGLAMEEDGRILLSVTVHIPGEGVSIIFNDYVSQDNYELTKLMLDEKYQESIEWSIT